ncbi:Site-specific recombinase XerD [Draconibacterium orientale]|jgi:site-specific recombinase XerD|uniref:Site-specific recombinase XerD n=1 Tax=Draconibacterium orientale TaxID=1168034 RepID=A0A1I0ABG2_9BACT|nr:site-specific integrase [Draconibacterium orientale]SES90592.1 Site-specific recombinase XerD [Draconibacterium orientale]
MRITIAFLLKKSKKREDRTYPVYVRFTLNGKRAELSTKIFVDQNSWDISKERMTGSSSLAKTTNNRLDKVASNILDIYNQFEAQNKKFDVVDIKNKLCGIEEEHGIVEMFGVYMNTIESNIGKGFSATTLKHYKTSKNRLLNFLSDVYGKKEWKLGNIGYKFINDFDVYLKSKYNNSVNTAWCYHKHMKKVLNIAVAMDYLSTNPYLKFQVKTEQPKREFLTQKELKKIRKKKIEIERLAIVRDIFLFACYTGLSYADISKLAKHHIRTGNDGKKWIIIDRTKNGSRCRVPLLPFAKNILKRYKNYPINVSKGLLLPVNSNQKMNAYLKEISDICGITKNLSMHVARHTFATTITLNNGVPIETVSKILGHNSLKTTQIYARILDYKISEDMKKVKII